MKVIEIMTNNVVTVGETETTGAALDKMKKHGIHHLVVLNPEKKIVGIISDKDLRLVVNVVATSGKEGGKDLDKIQVYNISIKRIMTPNPISIEPEQDVSDVAKMMLEQGFSSLPIAKDRDLIGIVTHHDILRAVADKKLK
ncbi:CBS domain-containing protein [Deltaproteobacteria bacterium TL4]